MDDSFLSAFVKSIGKRTKEEGYNVMVRAVEEGKKPCHRLSEKSESTGVFASADILDANMFFRRFVAPARGRLIGIVLYFKTKILKA